MQNTWGSGIIVTINHIVIVILTAVGIIVQI